MLALVASLALASTPEVALLSTPPLGDTTELRFQPVGTKALALPSASFTHVEGSTVSGVVLPGTRVVLAVATTERTRDESFAASLVRLEAGKPAKTLAEHVTVASRPLVTPEGRVFVVRGAPGTPPAEGAYRVDALSLDEVNPATGALRTVLSAKGYFLFLAGALGRELVVYRVDEAGARLEAVHADTLGVRPLGAVPDTARDFVVDAAGRRVLFTAADAVSHRWQARSLDLGTHEVSTLAQGTTMALLPTLWPDGRVAVAPIPGGGLIDAATGTLLLPSHGPGYERVRVRKNGLVVGLHETPSALPTAFALREKDGAPVELVTPPGTRVDVAGVLP
jgi:hypothetical protein